MSRRTRHAGITRREILAGAALGAAGLAALGGRRAFADPETVAPRTAKAKAVIEIWLAGGPSHLDTFDPKPDAGQAYTGPLDKPIDTNADGIRIGQSLPMLAKQADKYALIRSMTHGVNAHETAAYIVQTGRRPGTGENALVYPSFGAIASGYLAGGDRYKGRIPPYVVLTRPQGRFAVEGFLGLARKPFVTGGDPRRPRFAVEGIVVDGISEARQRGRRDLLHELDTLGQTLRGHPSFERMDRAEDAAYELILGDAGKVFDLTREKDAMRDRYGRTTLGQSCLAARRLIEEGVPYVTINSGGWDSHKRHFETMRQRLADLDRSVSALLEDLAARGLLDSTIVWCCGEFGRTPKVQWEAPWNGGRGHHGRCFSALVAGGGFRGGHVVGTSDEKGIDVASRPVLPHDLQRTMYGQLGVDADGPLPNPRGLDVTVLPPSETGTGRGRLVEIV